MILLFYTKATQTGGPDQTTEGDKHMTNLQTILTIDNGYLRNVCIKHSFFTGGTVSQYDKLFCMNMNNASLEVLADWIYCHSHDVTLKEVQDALMAAHLGLTDEEFSKTTQLNSDIVLGTKLVPLKDSPTLTVIEIGRCEIVMKRIDGLTNTTFIGNINDGVRDGYYTLDQGGLNEEIAPVVIDKIVATFKGQNEDGTVIKAKRTYKFNDFGYLGDKITQLEKMGEKFDAVVMDDKGFDGASDNYTEVWSYAYTGETFPSIEALQDHITELHRS